MTRATCVRRRQVRERWTRRWLAGLAVCAGLAACGDEPVASEGTGPAPSPAGPVVRVEPTLVTIPPDRVPVYRWPDWTELGDELGHGTFVVSYRVGPGGMREGGGIQVGFGYWADPIEGNVYMERSAGYMLGPSNQMKAFPLGAPRTEFDGEEDLGDAVSGEVHIGLVPVECATVIVGKDPRQQNVVQVTTSRELPAGTLFTVTLGAMDGLFASGPGAVVSWHPGRLTTVVYEDLDGDLLYELTSAELPEVLFTGERADAVHVHAPLTPTSGEAFTFTARAMQGHDDAPESSVLPVEHFAGKVEVTSSDPDAALPDPSSIGPEHRGVYRARATLRTPGVHHLTVTLTPEDGAPVTGVSHPIWVGAPAGYVLYAGDLQRHSAEGGHASQTAVHCWQQLYDRRDDFGGVVHHIAGRYAGFQHTNHVARRFQRRVDPDEQEFVAFPAYEWSKPAEHRHVVYREFSDSRAFTDREYRGAEQPGPEEAFTLKALFDGLRRRREEGIDALAIVHHTLMHAEGWPRGPFDWGTAADLEVQPLVEIYNRHGGSERRSDRETPAPYAMKHDPEWERPAGDGAALEDALARGLRFGVIAGSDNHTYGSQQGRLVPGGRVYSRGGLAIVLGDPAEPRLRDRIFDALQARRTYGTTGARILLHFETTSGAVMGETTAEREPRFRVSACAAGEGKTATFQRLQVYRDGTECVLDLELDSAPILEHEFEDPAPPEDDDVHSYYVRLTQDDLHMAWSSPIWVGGR